MGIWPVAELEILGPVAASLYMCLVILLALVSVFAKDPVRAQRASDTLKIIMWRRHTDDNGQAVKPPRTPVER
jgi:hypothetical protein